MKYSFSKAISATEHSTFRTLYVIRLSDRVYNVTFPAYDLYSLSRECHFIYI